MLYKRGILFMSFDRQKIVWYITLLILLPVFGCANPSKPAAGTASVADVNGPNNTIGMLAEVFASNPIPIRGYGLVGGLNGTGSTECPAQIRTYLDKYILQHLSGTKVNIGELISSMDTAVVIVDGVIPAAASRNQRLDVRVIALPGTQTASLENGWLYGADLFEARQLGVSINTLATAAGPIYVDSIESSDTRTGYILGGATVIEEYKINLALRRPDYRVASMIRNRINERFGPETAVALAPGSVELHVPFKYTAVKERFIQLVRATYLFETPQLVEKRVNDNIQKLVAAPNKYAAEITLEAIGNDSLPLLAELLNSPDAEVRLRAARCMLNLGDKQGLEALWKIAADKSSSYRIEAVDAVANGAAVPDAITLLRGLLRDDDFSLRLAAYENLVRLNDSIASKKIIANSFYLDQIGQSGKPAIFISRRNQARVALFGSPVYCRDNVFIESPDKTITINVPVGESAANIIRKHPRRPDTIIQLKSSLDLADIIQTLCKEPMTPHEKGGPGLGVSYSVLAGLLKQMADSGAVQAQFYSGPLPKTFPIIKK
jgi:flagellar basal body P-ring protein FlgI